QSSHLAVSKSVGIKEYLSDPQCGHFGLAALLLGLYVHLVQISSTLPFTPTRRVRPPPHVGHPPEGAVRIVGGSSASGCVRSLQRPVNPTLPLIHRGLPIRP